MGKTIEYATYRLASGVREEDFLEAVKVAMEELGVRRIPIKWELYRVNSGEFVDLIRSDDPTRTEEDFKALLQVPKIQKVYAMLDRASLKYTNLELKLSYP